MKNSTKLILLVGLVLLIDQIVKIWVKTNMYYGDTILILGQHWAQIHFVENKGMAFGIELGGDYGKLVLSLFRLVAIGFLIYYLNFLMRAQTKFGLLACFALILAGAVGNMIDSAFYGLLFSDGVVKNELGQLMPYGGLATLFPEGGGYAGFLHGNVVDMFYFPILENKILPEWLPIWGGKRFTFFGPVFNIADTSITVGVLSLLLFHRDFFSGKSHPHSSSSPSSPSMPE